MRELCSESHRSTFLNGYIVPGIYPLESAPRFYQNVGHTVDVPRLTKFAYFDLNLRVNVHCSSGHDVVEEIQFRINCKKKFETLSNESAEYDTQYRIRDFEAAAANDNAIIVLEEGTYSGNIEIRSEGVLIFGAWDKDEGPLSIIEGDVTFLGGSGRIRGVQIEGQLSSPANGFSAAFCTVESANITGNGVTLIRNQFTEGQATVPSSNAVLVDNVGIP